MSAFRSCTTLELAAVRPCGWLVLRGALMYAKAGGKSVISGTKLLPPEHPMFHFQFSHILGKGTFPELRLMEENITPCTVDEHAYYTDEPEKCRKDPAWAEVFKIRERLMLRAHAA